MAATGVLLASFATLAGCANLASTQPSYTYYVVPCDTPGAILTGAPPAGTPTTGQSPSRDTSVPSSENTAPAAAAAPICVVSARRPPTYARSIYYPSNYYSQGYYARPAFSSFGFGYYGGGHRGGGYVGGRGHGGGARASGHGGGGRH